MANSKETEEAFERGRRVGQLEGVPFRGVKGIGHWLPEARFSFFINWFDSFARYERELVENLREVQRVRWLLQRGAASLWNVEIPREGRSKERLVQLEREILNELLEVRLAVSGTLDEGYGRAAVVASLRAVPQRPISVVEYQDTAAFVTEDSRRGRCTPTHVSVKPGASLGLDWRLENPFRRWETTTWNISWACGPHKTVRETWGDDEWFSAGDKRPTHEVYAIETLDQSSPFAENGRVWLLGTIHKRASIERALDELRLYAMHDRNSLIAAAGAIASVQEEEAMRPAP